MSDDLVTEAEGLELTGTLWVAAKMEDESDSKFELVFALAEDVLDSEGIGQGADRTFQLLLLCGGSAAQWLGHLP